MPMGSIDFEWELLEGERDLEERDLEECELRLFDGEPMETIHGA